MTSGAHRLTPDHHRLIDAAKASSHCGVVIWEDGRAEIFAPQGVRIQVHPGTQPHAAAHTLGLTLDPETAS